MTFKSPRHYRFRFGYNEAEDQANKGRLRVRPGFCACSNFHAPKFNFGACRCNSLVGRLRRSNAQLYGLYRELSSRCPRFAATLKDGEFRAVDVARDEVYKEGALFFGSAASLSLLISSLLPMSMPGIPLTRADSNSMTSTQLSNVVIGLAKCA